MTAVISIRNMLMISHMMSDLQRLVDKIAMDFGKPAV